MELRGKLTLSRPDSNYRNPYISISLIDCDAAIEIFECQMGLEDFAMALTGLGRVDCTIITSQQRLENIGTVMEIKHEFVPGHYDTNKEEALSRFEVDGWKAAGGFGNHHCYAQKDDVHGYTVTFRRNVPKKD